MPIKTITLTLDWAEMITPNVRHLALKRADGEPFAFTPGQFITVYFEVAGKQYRRSYSIATIPGQTDLIEIAASYVKEGLGTKLLFDLQPGEQITVGGPFGRLILRDEQPQRYLLVATGTGITPYRSMLPELAQRIADQGLKVTVLLGVQTRQDALYADDFLAFAKQHPELNFHAYYSRETGDGFKPHEHQGYVQTAFENLQPNPETDIVYLCGNPGMIDDAFELLKTSGFDPKNVRREKYISSK